MVLLTSTEKPFHFHKRQTFRRKQTESADAATSCRRRKFAPLGSTVPPGQLSFVRSQSTASVSGITSTNLITNRRSENPASDKPTTIISLSLEFYGWLNNKIWPCSCSEKTFLLQFSRSPQPQGRVVPQLALSGCPAPPHLSITYITLTNIQTSYYVRYIVLIALKRDISIPSIAFLRKRTRYRYSILFYNVLYKLLPIHLHQIS